MAPSFSPLGWPSSDGPQWKCPLTMVQKPIEKPPGPEAGRQIDGVSAEHAGNVGGMELPGK